ncbi:hypothetical protein [Actinophytocola sp.]|uniref:hypothetical protein n=1 Tax=Actinophytocola sp. TaxID=1872138 RepID=UPI002ED43BD2
MDTQANPTADAPASASRDALLKALPAIQLLAGGLHKTLLPILVLDGTAPEAEAMDQATTAIKRVLDAVAADDPRSCVDHLTDAVQRLGNAVHDIHKRVAELQPLDELGADENERRVLTCDTEVSVDRAQLTTVLPIGTAADITVAVSPDGLVEWRSDTVALADVDGAAQLAVTAALAQIGEALTPALPDDAFPTC